VTLRAMSEANYGGPNAAKSIINMYFTQSIFNFSVSGPDGPPSYATYKYYI
jgi:hypothetical protein